MSSVQAMRKGPHYATGHTCATNNPQTLQDCIATQDPTQLMTHNALL